MIEWLWHRHWRIGGDVFGVLVDLDDEFSFCVRFFGFIFFVSFDCSNVALCALDRLSLFSTLHVFKLPQLQEFYPYTLIAFILT